MQPHFNMISSTITDSGGHPPGPFWVKYLAQGRFESVHSGWITHLALQLVSLFWLHSLSLWLFNLQTVTTPQLSKKLKLCKPSANQVKQWGLTFYFFLQVTTQTSWQLIRNLNQPWNNPIISKLTADLFFLFLIGLISRIYLHYGLIRTLDWSQHYNPN